MPCQAVSAASRPDPHACASASPTRLAATPQTLSPPLRILLCALHDSILSPLPSSVSLRVPPFLCIRSRLSSLPLRTLRPLRFSPLLSLPPLPSVFLRVLCGSSRLLRRLGGASEVVAVADQEVPQRRRRRRWVAARAPRQIPVAMHREADHIQHADTAGRDLQLQPRQRPHRDAQVRRDRPRNRAAGAQLHADAQGGVARVEEALCVNA